LTINQAYANVENTMAVAAEKQTTKTTVRGSHRLPRQKGGRHAAQEAPQIPLPIDTADAVTAPRTRRGRLGRVTGAITLGIFAALAPAQHTAEHSDVTSTVTQITHNVKGLAQSALTFYNQSKQEHLNTGTTSDGGRNLTLQFTSPEFGAETVTVSSTETQPGPNGEPEPDPSAVSSVSAVGLLATGASSVSFILTPGGNGNWRVSNTYPQKDSQAEALTEVEQGQSVTKLISQGMGHRPRVLETIPGDTMAKANVRDALSFAEQLIPAVGDNSIAPPQATIE
jgi:hypothetical protein